MKFREAMDDHSIAAIRLPRWANKDDRVLLPEVFNGARGPWAKLVYADFDFDADPPKERVSEKSIFVGEFATDDSDYEVYTGSGHPAPNEQRES